MSDRIGVIHAHAHTSRPLLIDDGNGEDMCAAGFKCSRDLRKGFFRSPDMFHDILGDVQVDAVVRDGQLLQVLAAVAIHCASQRSIAEEVSGDVVRAVGGDALTRSAIAWGRLMTGIARSTPPSVRALAECCGIACTYSDLAAEDRVR
jgi:hypothetical protein